MIFGLIILITLLAAVGTVVFGMRAGMRPEHRAHDILACVICAIIAVVFGMTLLGVVLTAL